MSWLVLPKKIQKLHRESLYSISKDWETYQIKDFREPIKMLREMGFSGEIDMDNSNQEYLPDYSGTLVHNSTPQGHAYQFVATMP